MAAKSTTAFFNKLESFQGEISHRVKELRDAAERENPSISKRPTRLAWLDELDNLEEVLITQTELSRSAVRLDALVNLADSAADSMQAVLSRAEALASVRYSYILPTMAATPSRKVKGIPNTPTTRRRRQTANEQVETPQSSFGSARSTRSMSMIKNKVGNPTPYNGKTSDLKSPIPQATPARPGSAKRRSQYRRGPSPALSDPPTPNMEDLGLSSATLHLLQRM